jgi:hypothetical protein
MATSSGAINASYMSMDLMRVARQHEQQIVATGMLNTMGIFGAVSGMQTRRLAKVMLSTFTWNKTRFAVPMSQQLV